MGSLSNFAPVRQLHGEWDRHYPDICVARASNWAVQAFDLLRERCKVAPQSEHSLTEFQREAARVRRRHFDRALLDIRAKITSALNEVGQSALSAEASLLRDRVELDCADLDAYLAPATTHPQA